MCLQRIPGLIDPLNTGPRILYVYKFGIINDTFLESPFQRAKMETKMEVPEMTFHDNLVECGLHSYLSQATTECAIKRYKALYNEPIVLLSCIVPPDTDYYVGINGDVVSQKLQINFPIHYTKAFDETFTIVLKDGSTIQFSADSKEHLMLILNYFKIDYKNIVEF